MYLFVAFAVTVLVIALAWRGVGVTKRTEGDSYRSPERPTMRPPFGQPPRPQRPQRRFIAPDDDPEFLSEIDRRLREEGKSN